MGNQAGIVPAFKPPQTKLWVCNLDKQNQNNKFHRGHRHKIRATLLKCCIFLHFDVSEYDVITPAMNIVD